MEGVAEALEGLRRSETALRAYGDERGLSFGSEAPWPGYVPAEQQTGPIRHAVWTLSGRLPGGAVGTLRHQAVFGETLGIDVAQQHTIMVGRLPESVGYVPMLCVRPKDFGSGLYYWGGDQRPRESQEFESVELHRRYVVDVARFQGENWIWQLFSPALIDWLAHETPPDFGFKLETGVFTCEVPQWRGQSDGREIDPDHLDLLASCGGNVAGRIRDEVLEEIGTGSNPASLRAYADWVSRPSHGRIVGAILGLFGGGTDDSVKRWADEHGMNPESPAEFHSRHPTLPLPGAAQDVATGTLPGTATEGSVAWISFSSPVDVERNFVAVIAPISKRLAPVWVDVGEAAVPGYGGELSPAALEAASAGGFGLSAADGAACAYIRGPGPAAWPPRAAIEEFIPRGIAALQLI